MSVASLDAVMKDSVAQDAIMDRHSELQQNYLLQPALDRPRTGLAVLVSREPTLVSRG